MAAVELKESSPLLAEEMNVAQVYKGELEPEQKSEAGVAEGVPVRYTGSAVTVVATSRQGWSTGLFDCINVNDQWISTDAEVCALGCFAPCVLYATNRERLAAGEQFGNHCGFYTLLYLAGKIIMKGNFLAPLFTYPTRTQLRQKYNLQGGSDGMRQFFACSPAADPAQREKEDAFLDCWTHYWCHPCALCQEARELRRRVAHPVQPAAPLAAPAKQVMGGPATPAKTVV